MSPDLNIEGKSFRRVEAPSTPESTESVPQEGAVELKPEVAFEKEQQRELTPTKESITEGMHAQATSPTAQKDMRSVDLEEHAEVKQVEKILEEHLDELYEQLPNEKKEEFRMKGEETARSIDELLHKTKVKLKQVISLIVSWLSMIPGVNKFFIEQQAEIKANKLLEAYDRHKTDKI